MPLLGHLSKKVVAHVAESASALTLQEQDASSLGKLLDTKSSEESITVSPPTVANNTIDGPSSTSPFSHENHLAAAIESSSAPAVMDVSSSEDGTTSSEQSITTAISCTWPHNTSDGGSPPSASSVRPKILMRSRKEWHQVYYIRMDHSRYFHMYPNLGGPFQSVEEAEGAINRHLDELRHQAMSKEQIGLSNVERMMNEHYYFYPDGTPKRGPEARKRKNADFEQEHYLVQALVDQYNEDHHHFEDLAHELESIVGYVWIYENERWFYHFNFTTKKKAGSGSLFFAEVSHMQGEDDWEVSCCRMIDSKKDKGQCYGCINYGNPRMKHPNDISSYAGGHLDEYMPYGDDELSSSDEDVEAEEKRVRAIYKDLQDPDFLNKIYRLINEPMEGVEPMFNQ
ncbi:hypothetical protein EJB05_46397, partial [Eragrostis curvula]